MSVDPDSLPPVRRARVRAWARRRRSTELVYRAVVLAIGAFLVGAGLVMLVLPGPGWAAVIVGLVVLASEYAWARGPLDAVKRAASAAAKQASDPARRRLTMAITGALALLAGAGASWYVFSYGWSVEGLRWLPFV